MASTTPRASANTRPDADTVQQTAIQIYAVAGALEHARRAGHPVGADTAKRIATLHREVDALARGTGPSAQNPDQQRKARQLLPLLADLDRAARNRAAPDQSALAAAQQLDPVRIVPFGPVQANQGGSCAHALGLGPQAGRSGFLRAAGEVWFRYAGPATGLYRVQSAASPMDTEIAVFSHCPMQAGDTPDNLNDDAFGLAAAASIDLRQRTGPRWIRVRNLGPDGPVMVGIDGSGSISGRVTDLDHGNAPPNARVILYGTDGFFAGSAFVDSSTGEYIVDVPAGNYYAVAGADNHATEMWPHAPCRAFDNFSTCDLALASPVTVTMGGTTPDIDFMLERGAQISGTVRDLVSGAPLTNTQVEIRDDDGTSLDYTSTDSAGRYQFGALVAGGYYVIAQSFDHGPQIYDHVDCGMFGFCDIANGTRIVLASREFRQHVNFDLAAQPHLLVTIQTGGQDGSGYGMDVNVFDESGTYVSGGYAQPGPGNVIGPLLPGNYRVVVTGGGFFSQLFDHVDCATDCMQELPQGTLVTVSATTAAPELTFDLSAMPYISGRITDNATGVPLEGVRIDAVASDSNYTNGVAWTLADGRYVLPHLDPGSYYIVAHSMDHRDTAYPDAPCSDGNSAVGTDGCALDQAQPIPIARDVGNVNGIDIALPLNGSVSGALRTRAPGTPPIPVSFAIVSLYDAAGSFVADAYSSPDGSHYQIVDIAAGTYFAKLQGYAYFDQVYAGVDCVDFCDPAAVGTPITVIQGQNVDGIDFDPVALLGVVGRVTDAISHLGIGGMVLDLWDTTDTLCDSAVSNTEGYYLIGETDPCYDNLLKLSTDSGGAYIDQVYDGIEYPEGPSWLGLCSLDSATPISVPATIPEPIVANFVLRSADPIFANGFD